MNTYKKLATSAILALLLGCNGKEYKGEELKETTESQTETKLSIDAKNLKEVENEFKVDYYAAAEKYAGKQISVQAVCRSLDMTGTNIPHKNLVGYFDFFTSTDEEVFTKSIPTISDLNKYLTLTTDLPKSKWQPVLQFTKGMTLGYNSPLFDGDNQYYLIYDKKHDLIVSDNATAEKVALFIRANKATTDKQEIMEHVQEFIKSNAPYDGFYEDLIAGNFYYHSESIDFVETMENFMQTPVSAILMPCSYTIEGTVSTKILDNTIRLVNCKVVKTDWLIQKDKFFDKQVSF